METRGLVHLAFPFRRGYSYQDIPYILLLSFQMDPAEEILRQLTIGQEDYVQGYIEGENGRILLHTAGEEYIGRSAVGWRGQKKLTDLSVPVGKYGWELHTAIDERQDCIMRKSCSVLATSVLRLFPSVAVIFNC